MPNKLLILLFIFIIPSLAQAQSKTDFIADKICATFNEGDLLKSNEELLALVQSNSNNIYKKYAEIINNLAIEYERKFPNKNKAEIKKMITDDIRDTALQDCLIFQKISQKIILPEIKNQTKSVALVSSKLCELMNNSPTKNAKTIDTIINNNLFELSLENKDLIIKEYGEFVSEKYIKDVNDALMKTCPIYLKFTLQKR